MRHVYPPPQYMADKTEAITPEMVDVSAAAAPPAGPRRPSRSIERKPNTDLSDSLEVFRKDEGVVDFRTVEWVHASVIFMKALFATGVLSIPSALYTLGALPGAVNVVGWCLLNTHCAIVQGAFRSRHPGCHSVGDMAAVVGGPWLREVVGVLFLLTWSIASASGVFGSAVALNALSDHAACTNYFMLVSAVAIFLLASVRKYQMMAWLTWVGFLSIFTAVFIVVIGVAVRDRPAAAPQTGDFDLGYRVIGNPDFVAGITAVATIFSAGAGTSAFVPVISEMRRPRDYNKAVYLAMGIVCASYLTFSLVVYRWCGRWVASPSLGSAGGTVKKVSYGVGMIGLLVSACIWVHTAAKYLFVRILRGSKHLQANSAIHWATWLGCTFVLSAVAFLLAVAIPIFNYLVALCGSLTFAPLALGLPAVLFIHDHPEWRKDGNMCMSLVYWLNWLLVPLAAFLTVGGTYGVVQGVIDAYRTGNIGGAFSCADNSGSS